MAYTKYSLTPANNNAAPPDGAPEGMLPSAVNDTMRDMMAQIRDVGDGIRGGTYTMTAPVITGGSITGVALSGNTFTNPVISGGSINNTTIGATTASTGAFSTLSAIGNVSFDGGSFVFNETGADKDARFEGDTDANLLFLDASTDRIGIGTSSPSAKLNVSGGAILVDNNQSFQSKDVGGTARTVLVLNSSDELNIQNNSGGDGGAILFNTKTGGAESMRIVADGTFLVGTTSSSISTGSGFIFAPVYSRAGSSGMAIQHTTAALSGDVYSSFIYNAGTIGSITQSGTTAVLYNLTSDARLKTNIVDCPLGNIDDVKVRSFDWKSDGSHVQYGFIAQELVEVAPYAVHQPQDPKEMMAVDYSKLVPMMIKEIQDLKQRIKTLENK